MAKYHFNIRRHRVFVPDSEGENFRFFSEALDEAKASARDLAFQLIDNRDAVGDACVEITNDEGMVLAALPVSEVLTHPNFPRFKEEC